MRLRLLLVVIVGWCSIFWVCSPTTHSVPFPITDPDAGVTFNAYCGVKPGAETTTPINTAPITTLTYVYKNAPAGTYYCKVQAVRGSQKSLMSNEQGVTVP
jgi:hypothetical protein